MCLSWWRNDQQSLAAPGVSDCNHVRPPSHFFLNISKKIQHPLLFFYYKNNKNPMYTWYYNAIQRSYPDEEKKCMLFGICKHVQLLQTTFGVKNTVCTTCWHLYTERHRDSRWQHALWTLLCSPPLNLRRRGRQNVIALLWLLTATSSFHAILNVFFSVCSWHLTNDLILEENK